MRALIPFTLVLIPWAMPLSAQTPTESRGQGYVFFAPGVSGNVTTLHIGGGGEGFLYKGLGLGAEIGAVGPWSGYTRSVRGLGSVNLSYHVLPKTTDRKLEPFVTAGYTILVRAGTEHGVNFGGGVNVWVGKRLALRFECRDSVIRRGGLAGEHNVGFRIGVTVR